MAKGLAEWSGGFCGVGQKRSECLGQVEVIRRGNKTRTTPGIPTWSPTVVKTRPDDA